MPISCEHSILCPGSDFPITNYSAESAEQTPQFFSVYFPTRWDKMGCISLCVSDVSQNAADLCAIAQEALCGDPPPMFCSVATTCSCESFGGSEFFYTTPAGTFCAETQEASDALAYAYACDHCGNPGTSTRLGALNACTCVGVPYSDFINYYGPRPLAWMLTDGSLPDGLSLDAFTGLVSGTPTMSGTFVFGIRAFIVGGNYAHKTFSMTVLQITTSMLTGYTLGSPYAFQMQVSGGSGPYSWRVTNGTLPVGLALSSTGLISGTPTATGTPTIQFQVADTQCETLNDFAFPAQVSLRTSAITRLKVKRGYAEFSNGTGKLYKKAAWSGSIKQLATTTFATWVQTSGGNSLFGVGSNCGGAKYVFSGVSEIDAFGKFISHHRKDMFVECVREFYPPVAEGPDALLLVLISGLDHVSRIHTLLGYCWIGDQNSCAACSTDDTTWPLRNNYASDSQFDAPNGMLFNPNGYTKTPTSNTYNGTASGRFAIADTNGLFTIINNVGAIVPVTGPVNFVDISSSGNYQVVLSNEYTEADALASQTFIASTGATAENKPDYLRASGQQFLTFIYSRFTTVDWHITCSNLIPGNSYRITYDLFGDSGLISAQSFDIVASAPSQIESGTVPTPDVGKQITIKNVRIRSA